MAERRWEAWRSGAEWQRENERKVERRCRIAEGRCGSAEELCGMAEGRCGRGGEVNSKGNLGGLLKIYL